MDIKKFSLLTFSVFINSIHLFSQWDSDPAINTPVCMQPKSQEDVRLVTDSKNGAIMTWLDFRNDSNSLTGDIFSQRIDRNGITKWNANGVSICTQAHNQTAPNLVEDESGGAIIAWNDWRNGNRDIYAQKIDSSGAIKWTANGVIVVAKGNHQQDAKLISDGAGGAILVWQDSAVTGWDVYAQRINDSGVQQWAANGVIICNAIENQVNPRIETDSAGGAIIVWQDRRNGVDYDIFAQRVSASGAMLWGPNGIPVCSLRNSTQSNPKIEPDGLGGAIIVWQDRRNGVDYDVYAQSLNSSGLNNWTPTNGIAICDTTGSQSAVDMTSEGINGAIITWKDERAGNLDIYAQKINRAGNVQWKSNGVSIGSTNTSQINPNIVGDGSEGAIIVWQDSIGADNWDVKSGKINSSGIVEWVSSVGTAADNQTSPKSVSDGMGGCIFGWQDKRKGNFDIYAHHLYSNGTPYGINENNLFAESRVFPNPFREQAIIEIKDFRFKNKDLKLQLYDTYGKEITLFIIRNSEGLIIHRNNLSLGMYFYVIKSSDRIISTGKLIITD